MLNIAVEAEDGLQIKIGDQMSLYLRGGLHVKSGLRFSIRDDIHGEFVRIQAKYDQKPAIHPPNPSFCEWVFANGRGKKKKNTQPRGLLSSPRGCVFRYFFSTICKNPFTKIRIWGVNCRFLVVFRPNTYIFTMYIVPN